MRYWNFFRQLWLFPTTFLEFLSQSYHQYSFLNKAFLPAFLSYGLTWSSLVWKRLFCCSLWSQKRWCQCSFWLFFGFSGIYLQWISWCKWICWCFWLNYLTQKLIAILLLFWIHWLQSSYRIKPLFELQWLGEICFNLVKNFLVQLLVLKTDCACSRNSGVPFSRLDIQKLVQSIFCHHVLVALLSCSLDCKEVFLFFILWTIVKKS